MNTLISQTEEQLTIKGLVEDLTLFAEYANQHLQAGYQIILSGSNMDDPQYVTITIPINYPAFINPVRVYANTYMPLSRRPRVMIIQHESPATAYALQIEDLKLFYYPPKTE